jgi:hypothetical protein
MQIFVGIYLLLGLPAMGLLLAALRATRIDDKEEIDDRPRSSVNVLPVPNSNHG